MEERIKTWSFIKWELKNNEKNNGKTEKYYTNEGKKVTRSTVIQINDEKIVKLPGEKIKKNESEIIRKLENKMENIPGSINNNNNKKRIRA